MPRTVSGILRIVELVECIRRILVQCFSTSLYTFIRVGCLSKQIHLESQSPTVGSDKLPSRPQKGDVIRPQAFTDRQTDTHIHCQPHTHPGHTHTPHTKIHITHHKARHAREMQLLTLRWYTSAYVSIRQHTSAYVSIRQHTSAVATSNPPTLVA